MSRRRRFHLTASLLLGPAVLSACGLLMTEPAAPSSEVEISFQINQAPLGGSAAAFSRVRRVFLRFVRPDSSFRDTVVAALPVDGVLRTGISLPTNERIEALGIAARLGFATTTLFEGATVVRIVPGTPTTAEITLVPVPDRIVADRPTLTLTGAGASDQLSSAVLYATGDTIEGLQGVWLSEDPTIVTVTPGGLAIAQRLGQTRLEARFDTLADTVLVDVMAPTTGLKRWLSAVDGNWGLAANWSGGSPPVAGDSVEITLDGTYTVTMDLDPPALAALSIGGFTGSQTLDASGRIVSVTGDVSIARTGSVALVGTTLTAASVATGGGTTLRLASGTTVSAPLTVAGLLLVDDGPATVTGAFATTATATVRVGGDVFASGLTIANGFVNNGQIELGGSARLTVSSGTLINAAAASLSTITSPIAGTAFLTAQLDNRGSLSLAEPLTIDGVGATHANSGTIASAAAAVLTVTGADAFDNSGTLDASNATADITLTGTGAGFATSGTIGVGGSVQLVIRNGPFALTAGSITGAGTLRLVNLTGTLAAPMALGSTGPAFLQLIGSTLTAPGMTTAPATGLLLQDGTLDAPLDNQGNMSAIGAATSTVTGAVTTTTTSRITVEAGSLGSPLLTFDNGFTNNGIIDLTNSQAGTNTRLSVTGTLVNSATGTISSLLGAGGGTRILTAQLDNQGAVQVRRRLDIDAAAASHLNSGTMSTITGDPLVVTGASSFVNTGALDAASGNIDIGLTGSGAGLTTSGSVLIAGGQQVLVRNGPFAYTGGSVAGAGLLQLIALSGSFTPPMALGSTGPTSLAVTASTLTAPGLTTGPGSTLTLNGSTLNAPLTNQAVFRTVGNASSNVTGAVTTTASSVIRVEGPGGGSAGLTIASGFTNNGSVVLTNGAVGGSATLTIAAGTLTNASSGRITALVGAGGGSRTLNGSVSSIGTIDLTFPLAISGQLIDPVGAPSTYTGNGNTLSVSGLDMDGAVFDNMPVSTNAGTLTLFNNVTFQNMDPTVTQLSISHAGAALPFTALNLTFSTLPSSGFYISLTDLDGLAPFLTVEVLGSSPASGLAQSTTDGVATLIW